MQKESSAYPELVAWYKARMSKLQSVPIMKFFNAKRVHTIHKGVVKPIKHVTPISNLKENGVPLPGQATMIFWQFDGVDKFVTGSSGGVFRLCEEYFVILREFVGEWLKKRQELDIT
jgi:hypothetical protein